MFKGVLKHCFLKGIKRSYLLIQSIILSRFRFDMLFVSNMNTKMFFFMKAIMLNLTNRSYFT